MILLRNINFIVVGAGVLRKLTAVLSLFWSLMAFCRSYKRSSYLAEIGSPEQPDRVHETQQTAYVVHLKFLMFSISVAK